MVEPTKEELALDLISGKLTHYGETARFSRIYPFSNEHVFEYLNFLDVADGSVLTVGSSADQAISIISRGCTDITVLDICPFTEEYFYLKSSAVQTLTPKEFDKIFFYKDYPQPFKHNKKPFALQKYPQLMKKIHQEQPHVYDFWFKLISTASGEAIRRNLFETDERAPSVTKQLVDYLKTEEAYFNAREKLNSVTPVFITADITQYLPDRKFDAIILSNLTTYLTHKQIHTLFDQLVEHLTPQGKIMLGYMYRMDELVGYNDEWNDIYNINRVRSINPDIEVKTIHGVKGILFNDPKEKDAVYIYQKKK